MSSPYRPQRPWRPCVVCAFYPPYNHCSELTIDLLTIMSGCVASALISNSSAFEVSPTEVVCLEPVPPPFIEPTPPPPPLDPVSVVLWGWNALVPDASPSFLKTSSYLKYKIYIEKFTIKDIWKKPIKLAKWHLVKEMVFVEMEWGSYIELLASKEDSIRSTIHTWFQISFWTSCPSVDFSQTLTELKCQKSKK